MEPKTPVVPGLTLPEVLYAKDQPPYRPLPVHKDCDGTVVSRWHMSWWERLQVLITGDVYLWQMTFNDPLQPVKLEVWRPKIL